MGKGGKDKGSKGKGKGKDKGAEEGPPLAVPITPKGLFDGIEQSEVAFSELEKGKGKPDKGKGKGKGKGKDGKDGKDGFGKDGKKGKGKKGKKGKGEEDWDSPNRKKKKRALEAMEDVDFDVPKISDRQVIQGNVDPKMLESLRSQALERKSIEKSMNDPADFTRRYNCAVNVTGIRNTTEADWEVFMAILLAKPGTAGVKSIKIKNKYCYSKSQVVKAGGTKMFKAAERIYFQVFQGSYKELQQQEIRIDLWVVQETNFNQHLGTSIKNLYQAGCEPVYQSVPIKMYKDERSATDGGVLFLNAMVSEILKTTITCSNWQFQPKNPSREMRCLTFAVPCGNGGLDRHTTEPANGPRYAWTDCGVYHYVGTKIAMMCEAMSVTVEGVGKALINLAGAGDFPIATGSVKTLADDPRFFEQGIVGGSITVAPRSLLLDDDDIDEDPSIPAPNQPTTSILMYSLDPNVQYLLLDVISAEGLPIGDEDLGYSNPFVRVRYDGMCQSSGVVEGTVRPVWNHNFFIPMRYIDKQMLSNPRFFNTLLPAELKSKGYIEVEVWHMDGVPTEFLGAVRLDPRQIRFGDEEQRSVCQKLAKMSKAKGDDDDDEDDEDETFGVDPALMKRHRTKVFHGNRLKLLGSRLQCQTIPRINFDACFVPDFPNKLEWPEQHSAQSMAQLEDKNERWNEKFSTHNEQYEAWFPDCPHNRRFLNTFTDARGETMPLPTLINSLALPQSLSNPGQVIHWVRCFEFTVAAKQKGKGQISNWNNAEAVLALRKGPVQDHGVILCSALLGLRKDAWVVKGTLRGGNEHVWCMTREQGGYVTFWETSTGAKYHLPGRWANDPSHGPPSREAANARWSRRRVIPDWREEAATRAEVGRRQQLRDMENLTRLPFSPFMELTTPDRIVPLPYESIEVVFNDKQLYANLTNHHPSCIFYDMEQDPRSWEPYLGPAEIKELGQDNKGIGIPVGPTVSEFVAEQMMNGIEVEVKESIRMTRIRKGYETSFDDSVVLREVLLQYLDNLEREITLDIDWQYDHTGAAQKPPGYPSPFNSQMYVSQCQQAWAKYWEEKKRLDANKVCLPVKENHVASAVPFHFSGTDIKEIRHHLMDCKPVLEYMNLKSDDNMYFVTCKIFPMANSVASVWCWIGVQMPIPVEQVFELSTQEGMAKQMAKDKGKGKKGKDKGKDDEKGKGKGKGKDD